MMTASERSVALGRVWGHVSDAWGTGAMVARARARSGVAMAWLLHAEVRLQM